MRAWSGTCRVLVLTWLVAMLAAMQAAPVLAGGRFALIIGNGNYDNAQKLPNAVKDATDLAAALGKLGFVVDLGTDLTLRDFKNKISDFRATVRANKASEAVFYYAGHGFALRGLNHLVPVDAELQDKDQIPYETLQLGDIVDTIQGADGQQTVIFLDACRDNPLPAKLRDKSTANGLANFEPPNEGIYLAFATAPGQVTLDGKGNNSPFASALLKYIDEPGQTINGLMLKVRNDVKKTTKGAQAPRTTTNTLSAEFIFDTGGQQVASAEPPAQQQAVAEPATKTDDQEDCPFYGCSDAIAATTDTAASKKSDPPATVPAAGGAIVLSESSGETVEGTVLSGQPQEGLSIDVSAAQPIAPEAPGDGNVGEGATEPFVEGNVASLAAEETQAALLTSDGVTRSAPAIKSEGEVAPPVKDGTVADSSAPASSGSLGNDAGTQIEGQVHMAPDAAPVTEAAPTLEEQVTPAAATSEPATADSGISTGTVVEGKVIAGTNETAPSDASPGKLIAGEVIQEAAAANPGLVAGTADAGTVAETASVAIPKIGSGTVLSGQVLPEPAVDGPGAADTGNGEVVPPDGKATQSNTVVASLPQDAASGDLSLPRDVQSELARVGCFTGTPDGNWGRDSRDALGEYFKKKKMAADLLDPTDSLLSDLKVEPDEVICVADNVKAPPKKERVQPSKPKQQIARPARPAPVKAKPAPRPQPVKVQPAKPKPPAPPKKKPDIFIGN